MVIAISLWLDQLFNGNIGRLATSPVYKPLSIVTLIVSIFHVQLELFIDYVIV